MAGAALLAATGCTNAPAPTEVQLQPRAAARPSASGGNSADSAVTPAWLPPGFSESVVLDGLDRPTAVAFGADGRTFVAEQSGRILAFEGLDDTPTLVADLRSEVHDAHEHGLLDLAVAPDFSASPFLYVLYTREPAPDRRRGCHGDATDPAWTGCLVSGRLSRLALDGERWTGVEEVLVEGWCVQFDSHSIGALAFAPDGALYASGGDGAGSRSADYGQLGDPPNPCGDPTGGSDPPAPPDAEGGALRSQDLLTNDDATGLSGTVIRFDPEAGAGLADNPLAEAADPNSRRLVAHGLRNPFRLAVDPVTDELWIGDVGWSTWEELNRLSVGGEVANFGWPCYEGAPAAYGAADYYATLRDIDPSAFWPLDDGVGNYGPGVAVGAVALVGNGTAASFNGAEDAVIDLEAPRFRESFSVALWLEAQDWESNPRLLSSTKWELSVNDTRLFFGPPAIGVAAADPAVSTAMPEAGSTHLVVATYDGGRLALYLDGRQVGASSANIPPTEAARIEVGRRFTGVLDDAVTFSRSLTATEVATLWAAGSGRATNAAARQPAYDALDLALCEGLYAAGDIVNAPHYAYAAGREAVAGDGCPTEAGAIGGLAFASGLAFPPPFADGLFLADFARGCIWLLGGSVRLIRHSETAVE